jgi:hypothetical protein
MRHTVRLLHAIGFSNNRYVWVGGKMGRPVTGMMLLEAAVQDVPPSARPRVLKPAEAPTDHDPILRRRLSARDRRNTGRANCYFCAETQLQVEIVRLKRQILFLNRCKAAVRPVISALQRTGGRKPPVSNAPGPLVIQSSPISLEWRVRVDHPQRNGQPHPPGRGTCRAVSFSGTRQALAGPRFDNA